MEQRQTHAYTVRPMYNETLGGPVVDRWSLFRGTFKLYVNMENGSPKYWSLLAGGGYSEWSLAQD